MKKVAIIVCVIILAVLIYWKTFSKPVTKIPKNIATCQALNIQSPLENDQVTRDFTVRAVVDNSNPKCHWTVFEAQAGTIEIKDANGKLVGNGELKTTEDWMTDNPVNYTSDISLDPQTMHG